MRTKITNYPTTVCEEILSLVEACGYKLFQEGMLYHDYRNGKKKIVFNGSEISYWKWYDDIEDDRGPHWHLAFRCQYHFNIDPIVIMDILNGIGAINYWQLQEARQMIRDIQNQIRKTQTLAYHD